MSLLASAGLHREACVVCVMACGRVVSPLEALWIRADAAKASGGGGGGSGATAGSSGKGGAGASVSGRGGVGGGTRPPGRSVLTTSGVTWGDEPTTFESPRRAVTATALLAHATSAWGNSTAPAGPAATGSVGLRTSGSSAGAGGGSGSATGAGPGDGIPPGGAIPAASLLHSVTLVADWRVNASLCTYYLPFLQSEHLVHALRRRCRHALVCGDRVALGGCLALGRARLPSRDFRQLRLVCGKDACVRLAAEVGSLPPLRRASVVDTLRRPRDVQDMLMPTASPPLVSPGPGGSHLRVGGPARRCRCR